MCNSLLSSTSHRVWTELACDTLIDSQHEENAEQEESGHKHRKPVPVHTGEEKAPSNLATGSDAGKFCALP